MIAHVNLMTERAKFIAAASRVSEAWAAAIGVLLLLMLPLGGWIWQRHGAVIRQHEALEASYEPIRRLAGVNRSVGSEAAALVEHEHVALNLARRRPLAALLGVVSEAIAETEGSAFIDGIHYAPAPVASPGEETPWRLTLEVTSAATYDISQLVDGLRRPPFTAVKILSSAPGSADGARRTTYVIECELANETK